MSREHVCFVSPAPRTMCVIQWQIFLIIYSIDNKNKVITPSLSTKIMFYKNDMHDYLKNTNSIHIILMVFGFSFS